jgi:hypothetical protein
MKTLLFLVLVVLEIITSPPAHAHGLGATCWARPFTAHRDNPSMNMCSPVGETQYPGINGFAGKALVIEECQRRNALDYGCAHGECCFPQCARVAICLWPTPNSVGPDEGIEL